MFFESALKRATKKNTHDFNFVQHASKRATTTERVNSCPPGAFDSSGQCQCRPVFATYLDGCICNPSFPDISVDETYCTAQCPPFSTDNGLQCACDGTLVVNSDTCGCPSGNKINFVGLGCFASCPAHSSDQGGQCQCDAPWVTEVVNQANCVCPTTLQLSLDGLNCMTPCPDHTIIVNNECICDGSSNFVLSSDKQSCECQAGTIYDSNSNTCLVACWTLNPPGNVPPSCYQCDATCKTCSGTNSNECLTCYPGYQLSGGNTCTQIPQTSSVLTTSVEVAKTTKKISSASVAASSVASVGNSGAMRLSLMGNMFQYLKFMNISYSDQLSNMLENLNSQFLPFTIDVGIPDAMQDESNYKTLAYQFTKYEDINPSFLMNFWDDLSILIVVIVILLVLVGSQFLLKRLNKDKTIWKVVFSKASLMTQSFLLTYTYNDLGSVIFFSLLDFKSVKSYSGVCVLNLIIAIILLLAEIGILTAHSILLVKYRRIKTARLDLNRETELEEFLDRHENLKAFFEDFNDSSSIQQCFLLIAVFRDMLCNLVLVTLDQHPLVESTCFMALSILMIVYIFYSGPFKELLNAIQQILCEGILLLVNVCVFINAVMDHIDSDDNELRKKLGSIVIVSNSVFNFVPMAFLAIALWQFLKELYGYLKGWWGSKRKVRDQMRTEEFHLKSEASDIGGSQRIFRGLSFEGGPIRSSLAGQEMVLQKVTEDLEILGSSKEQLTLESKMMSQNNSGVFEMKFEGEQGKDELIIQDLKEKNVDELKNNLGIRKVRIHQRGRIPPQLDGLSVGDIFGEVRLEGNEVFK